MTDRTSDHPVIQNELKDHEFWQREDSLHASRRERERVAREEAKAEERRKILAGETDTPIPLGDPLPAAAAVVTAAITTAKKRTKKANDPYRRRIARNALAAGLPMSECLLIVQEQAKVGEKNAQKLLNAAAQELAEEDAISISELRGRARVRLAQTRAKLMLEKQWNPLMKCEELMAKIDGLLVERVELQVPPTSPYDQPLTDQERQTLIATGMSVEQIDQLEQAALLLLPPAPKDR